MTQEVRMGGGGGGRVLGCEMDHLTHLEEPRARGNPACREFWHCPFLLKIVIKKRPCEKGCGQAHWPPRP